MEKILKARKSYCCSYCNKPIRVGEKHVFGSSKVPRFGVNTNNLDEEQVGIEYNKWRLHLGGAQGCSEKIK